MPIIEKFPARYLSLPEGGRIYTNPPQPSFFKGGIQALSCIRFQRRDPGSKLHQLSFFGPIALPNIGIFTFNSSHYNVRDTLMWRNKMPYHLIHSTKKHEILAELQRLEVKGAHFTNGVYSMSTKIIVPTTLAGFRYVLESQPHLPLIIALNSDESMRQIGKEVEPQEVRAEKIAGPLAEAFPDNKVLILFYDETTPNELYATLKRYHHTRTLHKWGYGTEPSAPKIEGAELFDFVYAYPLPNDQKPVCWYETPLADEPQNIQVVDLRGKSIVANRDPREGNFVLYELPDTLKEYQSPAFQPEAKDEVAFKLSA